MAAVACILLQNERLALVRGEFEGLCRPSHYFKHQVILLQRVLYRLDDSYSLLLVDLILCLHLGIVSKLGLEFFHFCLILLMQN